MDATLKYRIRKVAMNHFALTLFVVLLFIFLPAEAYSKHKLHFYQPVSFDLWGNCLTGILISLQPVAWLLFHQMPWVVSLFNISGLSAWLIIFPYLALTLFSIPAWSYCFGYIFVRTKDWLNHFPVLGKRVF